MTQDAIAIGISLLSVGISVCAVWFTYRPREAKMKGRIIKASLFATRDAYAVDAINETLPRGQRIIEPPAYFLDQGDAQRYHESLAKQYANQPNVMVRLHEALV